MASVKKIIWKETDGGGFKAICGGVPIGFIRKSLSGSNIYYPSLFNDKYRLRKGEYMDISEAKKALEEAFEEIVKQFIEF